MLPPNLPARLQSDGYITIPAREGGTGDFWFVSVLFVPLIIYMTVMGLQGWDVVFTPFMLFLTGILAWAYVGFFGSTFMFIWRRSRGFPGLHIDENGLYGSVLNVRGGRLEWADILAIDYQTSEYSIYRGISIAVSERVRAGRGLRYRREVTPLVEMLPFDAQLIVPLLKTARELWATEDNSPLLIDGRPIGLITDSVAVQDSRLEAIGRGEAVKIDYRGSTMRWQLLFGVPFLLVAAVGLLAMPALMWYDASFSDDEEWALWLFTIAMVLVDVLFGFLLMGLVRKWREARSGRPLYILDAAGLHEPSGFTLSRPLPWSACGFAYIRRHHKSPDMVMVPVEHIDDYTHSHRLSHRLTKVFRKWFQGKSVVIDYGSAGMRSDEMCDLLNAAILKWGSR
jgi:hypothetical protein